MNVIILLMGIAGTGKKTIGEAIAAQNPQYKLAHHNDWCDPVLKLLGNDALVFWSLEEKGSFLFVVQRICILNIKTKRKN
ncbi:MAG TPA: hypothetical protein PK657_02515 [Legionella sp.]|nr:hypothetical protein [Legionella sp.]